MQSVLCLPIAYGRALHPSLFPCESSGDQIRPNKGKEVIGVSGKWQGKNCNEVKIAIHAKEVKTALNG